MSQKGIFWVASNISKPDVLTPSTFDKWYNEVHVPDVLETSQIHSAYRYKNIDPSSERPYFAVYPVDDTSFGDSKEFASIPVTSNLLPEGKSIYDFAHFDARFYDPVQLFEREGAPAGPAALVISAALTPAEGTDDDFDAWYRQEHCQKVSQCTGYVRTRRYKLKKALTATGVPTYLALHEFASDSLPDAELAATAETEWGKKVMGSLDGQEIFVFKLDKSFGDANAKF